MRLNLKINFNYTDTFIILNIFFQHLFYYLYFEKKNKVIWKYRDTCTFGSGCFHLKIFFVV